MNNQQTEIGEIWGALEITRLFADAKTGRVCLGLKTIKVSLQVHATKTGKVRIYDAQGREWGPIEKHEEAA